jgi:hypothetical protein
MPTVNKKGENIEVKSTISSNYRQIVVDGLGIGKDGEMTRMIIFTQAPNEPGKVRGLTTIKSSVIAECELIFSKRALQNLVKGIEQTSKLTNKNDVSKEVKSNGNDK